CEPARGFTVWTTEVSQGSESVPAFRPQTEERGGNYPGGKRSCLSLHPRALQPESNAEHRIIVCTPARGNGEFWKKLSFTQPALGGPPQPDLHRVRRGQADPGAGAEDGFCGWIPARGPLSALVQA